MRRSLIVSTCGTSLLTNGADDALRRVLTRTANARLADLAQEDREQIQARVAEQQAGLNGASHTEVRRLSAELNGILGLYENQPELGKADQHVLLHTDTFQGEVVANMIRDWLTSRGLSASCELVRELSTARLEAFRVGMNELLNWSDRTLPGYRDAGFHVVFNLVGGFKSIQGFMQTLGMFYADETVYIFEAGNELLRIPRLPIEINAGARESLRQNLTAIRLLDAGLPLADRQLLPAIPETFLYRLGDEVDLSVWGRLIWKRHKPEFYREQPLPTLSSWLVPSSKTLDQAQQLPPERIAVFNERMDDLAVYLEGGQKNCPKRLDFKALKGNPCPPATHECDLWADADTQRAFGHFAGTVFEVDRIGAALHRG